MRVQHHPSEAVLFAYGTGSLREGLALAVASHLSMCPGCVERTTDVEAIGGALLETVEPVPLNAGALDAVLARIAALPPEPAPPPPPPERPERPGTFVPPPPLRPYLGDFVPEHRWQFVAPGVRQIRLKLGGPPDSGSAWVVKAGPGRPLPRHTHRGLEMTLVLKGSYTDTLGHFVAGDMIELYEDVSHQPVVDPDGECICLVAMERLPRFEGRILGPLQRLFGI